MAYEASAGRARVKGQGGGGGSCGGGCGGGGGGVFAYLLGGWLVGRTG